MQNSFVCVRTYLMLLSFNIHDSENTTGIQDVSKNILNNIDDKTKLLQ